jgi:Protein of unknown function (DUF4038)/Domain of unknown function (DUF5060)
MERQVKGHTGKLLGFVAILAVATMVAVVACNANHPAGESGVFEQTFESQKSYADPFNDLDVDVIFSKDGQNWRVPTFWRGSSKWTVRFAAPTPGAYSYHLESTDKSNPDLNGHEAHVSIAGYSGESALRRHGMLRVSKDKRHFEQVDGTPFYWLGDTWWTGLSDRLSWDGFQKLTANRKSKGFTVVQIVAGLVPSNEEEAPIDPGFHNEGGAVWDPQFKHINPGYFDAADRRIQLLADNGIAPAIVGAWHQALGQMGVAKMEKHWRYIIARYGAYPVFWVVGGEVFDPPAEIGNKNPGIVLNGKLTDLRAPGWSDVARYIRATDPYHHPVTVHEIPPPFDIPLNDESLTDFDLFQPSHMGWPSIALEVALVDMCRSRTSVTKPEVVGEIGYEGIGGTHLEDFQRTAFWLAMLNGAAGFTYGSNPVFEAYSTDKPFQRSKYTLLTVAEGVDLPGSYQISLGAKLLRQYPWWQFEPHPEWVTPRGTTLLEPRSERNGSELGTWDTLLGEDYPQPLGSNSPYPGGEWKAKGGNIFEPYAAGIPGKVRVIYVPCFGLFCHTSPTVLGLEAGVRYHAYYWEPTLGVKFDLGAIERPSPGAVLLEDNFEAGKNSDWTDYGAKSQSGGGRMAAAGTSLAIANKVNEQDLVAAVNGKSDASAGLVLRYHDAANYLAAVYSPTTKSVYLVDREKGVDGSPLGSTPVPALGPNFRLSAEARAGWAAVSITDGRTTYTSKIVAVANTTAGGAGLKHESGPPQSFAHFELRKSPVLVTDDHLEKKLYDARGVYRGALTGPPWDDFGKEKVLLLDAYQPAPLPMPQDWVLVLENSK